MRALLQIATALVLTVVMAVSAAAAGYAHGQPRVAGHIVICAGDQIVTLAVGEDGQPVETPHHCPDCVVKLAAVLAVAPTLVRDLPLGRTLDALPMRQVAATSPVLGKRARAPPVMV